MIYSHEELVRITQLEADIENARYWLKYWKESAVPDMIIHWHTELKKYLLEYNDVLDKNTSPINLS